MSNALTGDFDVVVEVAVHTVDRVLAAQHQAGTYLHSFSLRINDVPPTIHYIPHISLRSAIAGTHVSATRVEAAPPAPSHESGTERPPGEIGIREGVVGQVTALETGTERATSISSHETYVVPPQSRFTGVHGFAGIQISTPTITLPDEQSATSVTIHYQLMVHFLSDPGSPAIPEFLHGELQATVDIGQVAWQAGDVIEIDFMKDDIAVTFQPVWADSPLSSQQVVMIEKIIHNTLRTRFQPTNVLLPGGIQQIRFKTLPGAIPPAVALLLNLRQDAPVNVDPQSVTQGFLGDDDDFTIAAGRDYVMSQIDGTIGPIIRSFTPVVVYTIDFWIFGSYDCYLHLDPSYTIDWLPGQIVLTITGHVSTPPGSSDVYFSVKQAFHFDIENGSVILKPSGDPDLSIPDSGAAGWFARRNEGEAINQLRATRDQMLNKARPVIQNALDNSRNLGAILNALNISAQLNYTAVEIQPNGLLLHGTLSLSKWAPIRVESGSRLNITQAGTSEVELTAFDSWIPGGTIQYYTWTVADVVMVEQHRFITRFPGSNGPSQWCLRVQGTRITASGLPVKESVATSAASSGRHTYCRIFRPIVGPILGNRGLPVILPGPGPDPSPGVIAHIALSDANQAVASNTNTVVYVAGARVAEELSLLQSALLASEKKDSAVFVVAVLPPGLAAAVDPIDLGTNGAFALAENYKGSWGEVFEVNEIPALYLLNSQGQVVWWHVGRLKGTNLTAAFDDHLASRGRLRWETLQLTVQQGETAPDFLFEYEPSRQLALRKLRGHPEIG